MVSIPTSLGATVQPQSNRPVINLDNQGASQAALTSARLRGQGTQAVAQGLQKVSGAFQALQDLDDKRVAKDQLTQFSQQVRDITSPYYTTNGEDALNGKQGTIDKINKLREDMLAKAKNKRVAQMFGDTSTALIQPELDAIYGHAAKGHAEAFKASSEAAINEAVNRAVSSPSNQSILDQSMFIIEKETAQQLDVAGIHDSKTRETRVKNAKSAVFKEVIKNLVLNDVDQAEAFFLKNREKIDGIMQADIEQDILVVKRMKQGDEDHRRALARQAREDAKNAAFDSYSMRLDEPDILQKMMLDPNLDTRAKMTFSNWLTDRSKDSNNWTNNDELEADLLHAIYEEDGRLPGRPGTHLGGTTLQIGTREELQAFVQPGGITPERFSFLAGELDKRSGGNRDKYYSDLRTAVKEMLVKEQFGLSFKDPQGWKLLLEAMSTIGPLYEKGLAEGKSPADLTNPKSPNYVGKILDSPKFHRTPDQISRSLEELANWNDVEESRIRAPGSPPLASTVPANLPVFEAKPAGYNWDEDPEWKKLDVGETYIFVDKSGKYVQKTKVK